AREVYLVAPTLWPGLAGESTLKATVLYTAITRQGVLFFWPISLPNSGGRANPWSTSALEAAALAMTKWVRLQPDQSLGAYRVLSADHVSDPQWPAMPMSDMLRIAFKDRFIQSIDHPVLRQLRGEL